MAYDVRIDHELQIVESHWKGAATADMLADYVDRVWTDPELRNFNELIDFREVTDIQIPTEAIHAVAAYSRRFDNPDVAARSAVIAPPGLAFGLSRMFSTIRSLDPEDRREFKVFGDITAGRAWLEE